jgi:glycosyltransferase involved in cell wall biosynthesis
MKKIYIEASSFYGNRSGVGRYGLSITEKLMAERPRDSFTLFSFLRPGRQIKRDFPLPDNAAIQYIRWFPGRAFSLLMRQGIALPLELLGLLRADVVLFPNFITWASLFGRRRVSVVHDVAYLFYPEHIQAKNLIYIRRQLPASLKRSDRIIAVSGATKRDLVEHFGIAAEKISVVYNAVDRKVFNSKAKNRLPEVIKKYHIPKNYLLFAGNIEPRKNLEGLLRAYARSYPRHRQALVIVGAKGWNDSGIESRLRELTDLPIYRTNFVSDSDLAALYAGATALVYPSFYEGFGLPCLEAMACGCPVICGNNSSFPEVVGNAAIMVDAHNIDEVAKAMIKLSNSTKLREELRTSGLEQARRFSWEDSAHKLSQVIDSLG